MRSMESVMQENVRMVLKVSCFSKKDVFIKKYAKEK